MKHAKNPESGTALAAKKPAIVFLTAVIKINTYFQMVDFLFQQRPVAEIHFPRSLPPHPRLKIRAGKSAALFLI
jgi:hypothetical protein